MNHTVRQLLDARLSKLLKDHDTYLAEVEHHREQMDEAAKIADQCLDASRDIQEALDEA